MPGAWRPGNIYNVSLPAEHATGREIHDNPDLGPRPWVIVSSRFHKRTGLLIAVPMTRTPPEPDRNELVFDLGDVDTRNCAFPLTRGGALLVCQVRAVSLDRIDKRLRGRLKKLPLNALLGEISGLLEGVR